LDVLALVVYQQKRTVEAEPLYERALAIFTDVLGPDHPLLASSFDNLAAVQAVQGKYDKAEENYRKALAIRELHTAGSIEKIGSLMDSAAKWKDAESLYRTNLPLLERVDDPKILNTMLRCYGS
jgi:tetratricopeptide (TPR) repeat protein